MVLLDQQKLTYRSSANFVSAGQKLINRTKAGSNLDKTVTESEMHPITSKLDQNINQKPDQQINLDAIQM